MAPQTCLIIFKNAYSQKVGVKIKATKLQFHTKSSTVGLYSTFITFIRMMMILMLMSESVLGAAH